MNNTTNPNSSLETGVIEQETGSISFTTTVSPTIFCGIVIYGLDYIKGKIEQLKKWREFNPTVQFKIMTIDIGDNIKDEITELGFDVILIDKTKIPLLNWLVTQIIELNKTIALGEKELPLHFISDIMRWYCLDIIKDRAEYTCIMEADLVCNKEWIRTYFVSNDLKDRLTIFGEDRAFIIYNNASEKLQAVINMYNNIYTLLVATNVFGGNYISFIPTESTLTNPNDFHPNGYTDIYNKEVENYKQKLPDDLNNQIKSFIGRIPCSIMGIGIRQYLSKFFNLTYNQDPQYNFEYYQHTASKNWMECPLSEHNLLKHTQGTPSKRQRPENWNNSKTDTWEHISNTGSNTGTMPWEHISNIEDFDGGSKMLRSSKINRKKGKTMKRNKKVKTMKRNKKVKTMKRIKRKTYKK